MAAAKIDILPNDVGQLRAFFFDEDDGGYVLTVHFPPGHAPKLPENALRGAWFKLVAVNPKGEQN